MRIAVLNGYWSTNVGNSFFQLGARYALQKALPEATVFLVGDQQGYQSIPRGRPACSYDLVSRLKTDWVVVLGPVLRKECDKLLLPTVRTLRQRGVKVLFLGAGMMAYDPASLQLFREYMAEMKPDVFVTRDRATFDEFNVFAPMAYDGICPAFFVGDMQPRRPDFEEGEYVVWNFDQGPEPSVSEEPRSGTDSSAELGGSKYYFRFSAWKKKLASTNLVTKTFWCWADMGAGAERMGPYRIIRTDHRFNPVYFRKMYYRPNTYCGDTPESYFALYGNAQAVFSSRVHACAAALSLGRSAMLFSDTPRAGLLERAGAVKIRQQLVSLDMKQLDNQKEEMLRFLAGALAGFGSGATRRPARAGEPHSPAGVRV